MSQGVFAEDAAGRRTLVHEYIGGDYGLEDVPELLGIGAVDDSGEEVRLHLTAREVDRMKLEMDARGFDFEPDFVQMCLDMHRHATAENRKDVHFTANF